MKPLHTKEQDELEADSQRVFSKAVILAGVALLVLLAIGLLFARRIAGHVAPMQPAHPTSSLSPLKAQWDC